MKIKLSTIVFVTISAVVGFTYIRLVRPVGWFDAVVGIVLAVAAFYFLKRIKGVNWRE